MDEHCIAETEIETDTEAEAAEESHPEDEHLADVEDGCGCTEVWEHLSENRADE